MDETCSKIANFVMRIGLVEPGQKSALLNGAAVEYTQVSACKIQVCFDKYYIDYVFPYPVHGETIRLRIARKSSYIEVIESIWTPILGAWKGAINRFPVVRLSNGVSEEKNVLTSWNIHHVVLDSLPIIDLSSFNPGRYEWLNLHTSLTYSDRDKALRHRLSEDENRDVLISIKDSLHSLFGRLAGLQSSICTKIFVLYYVPEEDIDPDLFLALAATRGIYTVIFVNNARLDLGSHTIVADAFIVHLTSLIILEDPPVYDALSHVTDIQNGFCPIVTSKSETMAWMQLLPASVERCRQWGHKDTCEYGFYGQIPLSTEPYNMPICSCGQGKDADEFLAGVGKEWKALAPYVTRAAISPIFTVSFLEKIGGEVPLESRVKTMNTTGTHLESGSPMTSSSLSSSSESDSEHLETTPLSSDGSACVYTGHEMSTNISGDLSP